MHRPTAALAATAPAPVSPGEREIDDLRARALGRLTGHFAHELRNVLTGVRCYLELLTTVDLPPEFGGFMAEIQGSLDRMADLASLWHDLARGRCSTAHVNSELSRLMQMLRSAGVGKKVRLEEQLDPQAGSATVDATAFEAVLLAMLDDLVARGASEIRVRSLALDGQVQVRVEARGLAEGSEAGVDCQRLGALLGEPVNALLGGEPGFELWLGVEDPTA